MWVFVWLLQGVVASAAGVYLNSPCIRSLLRCAPFQLSLSDGKFSNNFIVDPTTLNRQCRSISPLLECMQESVTQQCSLMNISPAEREFVKTRLLVAEVCQDVAYTQKVYLRNAACINRERDWIIQACNPQDYVQLVNTSNLISLEGSCLFQKLLINCRQDAIQDKCGPNAADLYQRVKAVDMNLDFLCLEGRDLKSPKFMLDVIINSYISLFLETLRPAIIMESFYLKDIVEVRQEEAPPTPTTDAACSGRNCPRKRSNGPAHFVQDVAEYKWRRFGDILPMETSTEKSDEESNTDSFDEDYIPISSVVTDPVATRTDPVGDFEAVDMDPTGGLESVAVDLEAVAMDLAIIEDDKDSGHPVEDFSSPSDGIIETTRDDLDGLLSTETCDVEKEVSSDPVEHLNHDSAGSEIEQASFDFEGSNAKVILGIPIPQFDHDEVDISQKPNDVFDTTRKDLGAIQETTEHNPGDHETTTEFDEFQGMATHCSEYLETTADYVDVKETTTQCPGDHETFTDLGTGTVQKASSVNYLEFKEFLGHLEEIVNSKEFKCREDLQKKVAKYLTLAKLKLRQIAVNCASGVEECTSNAKDLEFATTEDGSSEDLEQRSRISEERIEDRKGIAFIEETTPWYHSDDLEGASTQVDDNEENIFDPSEAPGTTKANYGEESSPHGSYLPEAIVKFLPESVVSFIRSIEVSVSNTHDDVDFKEVFGNLVKIAASEEFKSREDLQKKVAIELVSTILKMWQIERAKVTKFSDETSTSESLEDLEKRGRISLERIEDRKGMAFIEETTPLHHSDDLEAARPELDDNEEDIYDTSESPETKANFGEESSPDGSKLKESIVTLLKSTEDSVFNTHVDDDVDFKEVFGNLVKIAASEEFKSRKDLQKKVAILFVSAIVKMRHIERAKAANFSDETFTSDASSLEDLEKRERIPLERIEDRKGMAFIEETTPLHQSDDLEAAGPELVDNEEDIFDASEAPPTKANFGEESSPDGSNLTESIISFFKSIEDFISKTYDDVDFEKVFKDLAKIVESEEFKSRKDLQVKVAKELASTIFKIWWNAISKAKAANFGDATSTSDASSLEDFQKRGRISLEKIEDRKGVAFIEETTSLYHNDDLEAARPELDDKEENIFDSSEAPQTARANFGEESSPDVSDLPESIVSFFESIKDFVSNTHDDVDFKKIFEDLAKIVESEEFKSREDLQKKVVKDLATTILKVWWNDTLENLKRGSISEKRIEDRKGNAFIEETTPLYHSDDLEAATPKLNANERNAFDARLPPETTRANFRRKSSPYGSGFLQQAISLLKSMKIFSDDVEGKDFIEYWQKRIESEEFKSSRKDLQRKITDEFAFSLSELLQFKSSKTKIANYRTNYNRKFQRATRTEDLEKRGGISEEKIEARKGNDDFEKELDRYVASTVVSGVIDELGAMFAPKKMERRFITIHHADKVYIKSKPTNEELFHPDLFYDFIEAVARAPNGARVLAAALRAKSGATSLADRVDYIKSKSPDEEPVDTDDIFYELIAALAKAPKKAAAAEALGSDCQKAKEMMKSSSSLKDDVKTPEEPVAALTTIKSIAELGAKLNYVLIGESYVPLEVGYGGEEERKFNRNLIIPKRKFKFYTSTPTKPSTQMPDDSEFSSTTEYHPEPSTEESETFSNGEKFYTSGMLSSDVSCPVIGGNQTPRMSHLVDPETKSRFEDCFMESELERETKLADEETTTNQEIRRSGDSDCPVIAGNQTPPISHLVDPEKKSRFEDCFVESELERETKLAGEETTTNQEIRRSGDIEYVHENVDLRNVDMETIAALKFYGEVLTELAFMLPPGSPDSKTLTKRASALVDVYRNYPRANGKRGASKKMTRMAIDEFRSRRKFQKRSLSISTECDVDQEKSVEGECKKLKTDDRVRCDISYSPESCIRLDMIYYPEMREEADIPEAKYILIGETTLPLELHFSHKNVNYVHYAQIKIPKKTLNLAVESVVEV